jgi:hypothetical protein
LIKTLQFLICSAEGKSDFLLPARFLHFIADFPSKIWRNDAPPPADSGEKILSVRLKEPIKK